MEMTLRKACGPGLGMALIVAFSIQVGLPRQLTEYPLFPRR